MHFQAEAYQADGEKRERLVCRFGGETIVLEGWGPDGIRVRARPQRDVIEPAWSVLMPLHAAPRVEIGERARLTNGGITAEVRLQRRLGADVPRELVIRFLETATGRELTAETRSHFAGPAPRAYRPIASESYRIDATFEAYDDERLWGLGQHHHCALDLKGTSTTLLNQNTHTPIPFVISSRGYGFFWHNPAVGRVDFARNITRWSSEAAAQIDYWICAGDTPRDILRQYVDLTGHAPEAPEWITGFWQSKLRYRSQEELLETAREHHRRGHPLSCIVIDFFHWTRHGEWRFDPEAWPDPAAMVRELETMGARAIVSIWPTVAPNAETWSEMRERGLLMRTEKGPAVMTPYPDRDPPGIHYLTYYDATLPEARAYIWERARKGYLEHGIENFWLDSCEPEIRPIHPETLRLDIGNGAECLNIYPFFHQKGFREGLAEAGHPQGALLCRSAWAGSQRFGVILWSGDTWSDWDWFRQEVRTGLASGLSGMAWWSSDIGGFYEGVGKDPGFRELLLRWFQFAVFTPICRLHGVRVPDDLPLPEDGVPSYGQNTNEIFTSTGGGNEIWSYGEDLYGQFSRLLDFRERLRPLLLDLYTEHAATGDPIMRPLGYEFPDDPVAPTIDDSFLLGPDILVAPVLEAGAHEREVYLPAGASWIPAGHSAAVEGGRRVRIAIERESVVAFARTGAASELLAEIKPLIFR